MASALRLVRPGTSRLGMTGKDECGVVQIAVSIPLELALVTRGGTTVEEQHVALGIALASLNAK